MLKDLASDARAVFLSIKPKISLSLSSNLSPTTNSPGLLAAERHLPRAPRADEEESKGSAPLAKDDTDETRRREGAEAAVVGVVGAAAALANAAPLVLAWPPRAPAAEAVTPTELREAVAARIVTQRR